MVLTTLGVDTSRDVDSVRGLKFRVSHLLGVLASLTCCSDIKREILSIIESTMHEKRLEPGASYMKRVTFESYLNRYPLPNCQKFTRALL